MFINCENISFKYVAEKPILNNITFALNKTKTLSIVGASGCGKSTLLRIISGLLPQKDNHHLDGKVVINGQTTEEYRKSGKLAFMFQEPTLMPNLTVKENIGFPLRIKGIDDNPRVENLLNLVGLTEFNDYLPKQLSGGMKTRVALARSFVTKPELLLLDEPFSALDIAWKSKLYIELGKLVKQFNTTVILVTHDVQEALLLSNQVLVMNRYGEIKQIHKIESSESLTDRVNDISGFMSKVYAEYFLPIQKAIMLDGNRKTISHSEIQKIHEQITKVAGDVKLENSLSINTDYIRKHSNNAEVNELLYQAYTKAKTIRFKHKLIWDILSYEDLSESKRSEIFDFYFENIELCSNMSREFYAHDNNLTSRSLLETLKGSIETNLEFGTSKKWIYLCVLYAIRELPETVEYLDLVIDGNVKNLDYQFAKEVAEKIKDKINEKVVAVSIA